MNIKHSIRIGGASGYWGDGQQASAQLLSSQLNPGGLDFLVYDYLAEITLSIMARARAKHNKMGFAPDFVTRAMGDNLSQISEQGVKVISNAGGVNPVHCARMLEALIAKQGLSLKVAYITGDDLLAHAAEFGTKYTTGMFEGEAFPRVDLISSIHAYIGAFAIANALDLGADIVITGRCVDSAVSLAACIHSFGWTSKQYDLLAQGSLAGHIIECGTQATGGNLTDWHLVDGQMANMGYPIAEINADGDIQICKPENTSGLVSVASIGEQIVYEIGDPQYYLLPDVTCDFSQVKLVQMSDNIVGVTGAKGSIPPPKLKAIATWQDGYRAGQILTFYGIDAARKASAYADAVFARCKDTLKHSELQNFTHTSVEILGTESQFGNQAQNISSREVCVKIAACHKDQMGVQILLQEITALALSGPPGLSGFAGTRPRPMPVISMFAFLVDREKTKITIHFADENIRFHDEIDDYSTPGFGRKLIPPDPIKITEDRQEWIQIPLIKLCYARSGDKGNKANIGIIARDPKFLPVLWQQLSEERISKWFAHFLEGDVRRYFMPGLGAINFVLDRVLDGGGTTSLRNDPQAKGYAQILLANEIEIPVEMATRLL